MDGYNWQLAEAVAIIIVIPNECEESLFFRDKISRCARDDSFFTGLCHNGQLLAAGMDAKRIMA
jgi:hypothetical protein